MDPMQQLRCDACRAKVELAPDDYLCPKCNHRLRESPDEVRQRIALEQTAHTVKRARLWLLIAVALNAAGALFTYLSIADRWDLVPSEVKLGVYLAAGVTGALFLLWALAARLPLPATALALTIYGGLTAIAIAANPSSLLSGIFAWLFRALVIVSLATGVAAAWKHRRLRLQLVL
jgi:hypothetical protein